MPEETVVQENPIYFEDEEIQKVDDGNDAILGVYEGPIQKQDEANENDRVYEEQFWDQFFESEETQRRFDRKLFLGRLTHPDEGVDFDLNKASHAVTDAWRGDDGLIYGTIEVFDTPAGQILETLYEAGVRPGVSSRAAVLADTDRSSNVSRITEGEVYGWDFVIEPSVVEAVPEKVTESITKESSDEVVLPEESGCKLQFENEEKMVEQILGHKDNNESAKTLTDVWNDVLESESDEEENEMDDGDEQFQLEQTSDVLGNLTSFLRSEFSDLEVMDTQVTSDGVTVTVRAGAGSPSAERDIKQFIGQATDMEPEQVTVNMADPEDDFDMGTREDDDGEKGIDQILDENPELQEEIDGLIDERDELADEKDELEDQLEEQANQFADIAQQVREHYEGVQSELVTVIEEMQDGHLEQKDELMGVIESMQEKHQSFKEEAITVMEGLADEYDRLKNGSVELLEDVRDRYQALEDEAVDLIEEFKQFHESKVDEFVGVMEEMQNQHQAFKEEAFESIRALQDRNEALEDNAVELLRQVQEIHERRIEQIEREYQEQHEEKVIELYSENVLGEMGLKDDDKARKYLRQAESLDEVDAKAERLEQAHEVAESGLPVYEEIEDEEVLEATGNATTEQAQRIQRIADNAN